MADHSARSLFSGFLTYVLGWFGFLAGFWMAFVAAFCSLVILDLDDFFSSQYAVSEDPLDIWPVLAGTVGVMGFFWFIASRRAIPRPIGAFSKRQEPRPYSDGAF